MSSGTSLDRPWQRPGGFRYALHRVAGFLQPAVSVGEAPAGLVRELDVDVPTRDGTRLEVNVHRPGEPGRFPVVLCAHSEGKDNLPLRKRFGYAVPWAYRRFRESEPISFSRMTSWQGPDPGWWVDRGYAVVNADLRGAGASDGEADPRSEQEAEDVADLVEWCGRQPWSNGNVGLVGILVPRVAPAPALKAVVAWEAVSGRPTGQEVPTLLATRFPAQVPAGWTHLWTHRSSTLASFYGDDALAAQLQFLDRHLRERPVPALPPVRLEVREHRDVIAAVRDEPAWPLPDTTWTPLYLSADGLATHPVAPGSLAFDARRHGIRFDWTAPDDVELTGPVTARFSVDLTHDACVVAGVEKWRGSTYVPFEGPYGFGRDRVATGWRHVAAGGVIPLEVGLGNSATLFRAGETLRLVVGARWLWPRNRFVGPIPDAPRVRGKGTVTLHWGGESDAALVVPAVSRG